MKISKQKCDLFECPNDGYVLAHCISSDFKLGAGIAKSFDNKYNLRRLLYKHYNGNMLDTFNKGCCTDCIKYCDVKIYNLVTKKYYYQKPTILSLTEALVDLKYNLITDDVSKLAIPLIGCGLDKLKWHDVYNAIVDVFDNTDIEILVCYL